MEFIGYEWLARQYGSPAVQALPSRAAVGKVRTQDQDADGTIELFPAVMRPAPTLQGHLTFALKHEGVHLEALARLFGAIEPRELEEWFASEPTGQYARRSCFLYEWITGKALRLHAAVGGNYVEALDPDRCLANPRPQNVPRWRVRDNLPGTRDFCPTVRWTQRTRQAEQYECAKQIGKIEAEFGSDVLKESASAMALEESAYSFALGGDGDATERISDFAQWMEAQCGRGELPLQGQALEALQRRLLAGGAAIGMRHDEAIIVRRGHAGALEYVAPRSVDLPAMLAGLAAFEGTTSRQPSVLRAAVLSYGFLFLRPLVDGNGRVSRYLVNETLRRDGAVPEPLVLPISVKLGDGHMGALAAQDAVQRYAGRLMSRFASACSPDASVPAGLRFEAYDQAKPTWAYPDLTPQAEYLGQVVAETVEQEVRRVVVARSEALRVRAALQEIVAGSDEIIDRLVQDVLLEGDVSQDVLEQIPDLDDAARFDQVLEILMDSSLPGVEQLHRESTTHSRPRG